ncbi:MAG: PAS domain S-box protein, partial [Gammaproteobacteria bacterium]
MKVLSFRSYQLKFWLPLYGLLLFSFMLTAVLWISYQNTVMLVHQRSEEIIHDTLKKLQTSIENRLATNDSAAMAGAIDSAVLNSETGTIALLDDQARVLNSNRGDRPQNSFGTGALSGFDHARFDASRRTLRILLQYHPDEQRYTAYAPVRFPAGRPKMQTRPVGAIYYVHDHAHVEAAIRRQMAGSSPVIASLGIMTILLFWIAQQYFVNRPLKLLALFVERIGDNDSSATNPLTGSGELMTLGQSLERMHWSLQNTLKILKFREQKLIVTLQSIGNGVIATDTCGIITRMNPIAERLTGWQSPDAVGQPSERVFHIIHTESHRLIPSPVRQVLETRQAIRLSNQILLYSRIGETFHIECNAAPIVDDGGCLHGVVLTFTDVSDNYRLREQLNREKQHLQYILDNSAMAIYSLLPNAGTETGFRFNYGSTRLEQLSGFSIPEWKSIDGLWQSRVHPDDLPKVRNAEQKIARKGRIVDSYRFLHADGQYRWIEDHLMALTNAAGEVYEVMGVWIDITETRQTQQAIELLGAMLDQSINEIQVIDIRTLRFVHVNQGGISHLGYCKEELAGMSVLDIYPEYDAESYARLIYPLLDGQQSQVQFETLQRRKDGSVYPVEIWLQLYRNAPDSLVAIALDITQRREHEEKINRLNNFYAILSKINQAIIQITDEDALFKTVCAITLELIQVKMTWIGKYDDSGQTIVPFAAAGDQQNYLDGLYIPVGPDRFEGSGPTATAFREYRIVAINDFQNDPMTAPWHDTADRPYGWKASCAVPISAGQQPHAVLNLYSDQKNYFDAEVLELLAELQTDLSFALDSYGRERVRRAFEQKLELFAKVFSQSRDAIVITDQDSRVISINQAFTRITGFEEKDVLGKSPQNFSFGMQDRDINRDMWKSLIKNDFWLGELVDRRKDGSLYTEWLSISVVRNENREVTHYIGIFTDITQLKVAKLQIEHLAHYDVLTNLPNRLLLKARVDHEIAVSDRHKQTFALLFIDLDHFKNINDALGHTVGDHVLIEVGKRLLSSVREEDTVARVGGDEFNIQLANTDWRGAALVAKHIIDLLAEPIHFQHYRLYIQPS